MDPLSAWIIAINASLGASRANGALAACMVGACLALGGGTARNLLLGLPPSWLEQPQLLLFALLGIVAGRVQPIKNHTWTHLADHLCIVLVAHQYRHLSVWQASMLAWTSAYGGATLVHLGQGRRTMPASLTTRPIVTAFALGAISINTTIELAFSSAIVVTALFGIAAKQHHLFPQNQSALTRLIHSRRVTARQDQA